LDLGCHSGQRECPFYVLEPVGQALGAVAEQEVVVGERWCGAGAMAAHRLPIEYGHRLAHCAVMAQTAPGLNAELDGGRETTAGAELRTFAGAALDVLLPPQCAVCGAQVESSGVLCPACWPEVDFLGPPQCAACGAPFPFDLGEGTLCGACSRERPPFDRARAVMAYGDVSRRVILAFKHGDRTDTAPALGRWLARAGGALVADADVIAPVPLHWSRLFQRRYNQAALLARYVARSVGKPVVMDALVRRRRTRAQGRMGPAERRRNLKGALKANSRRIGKIAGKRVLLIDDVFTTGATAAASARALLRAGAGAVDVLTLARVVRPEG
jgi:ComF family protein